MDEDFCQPFASKGVCQGSARLHLGHARLEDGGQQHEVVVLHPHHVARAVVAQQHLPEFLIRRLVRRPLELRHGRHKHKVRLQLYVHRYCGVHVAHCTGCQDCKVRNTTFQS